MTQPKKFLFFVPVLLGIILVGLLVNNRKSPMRPEVEEVAKVVKVVEVEKIAILPKITGYGYVVPSETWEAIPEVSGRVVETHPELKRGTFVAKGELLVRIDPESYGLAQSRGEASVMNIDAQLVKLEQERVNTEKLLEIEQQSLKLTENEVERKRKLLSKGVISPSEMEKEEKNLLSQKSSINNLKNILSLIPSRKKELLARKDSDVSNLTELTLDLEKTTIRAPFDCRIAEVNIEKNQFASVGQGVVKAISIAAVEIPVQLSPNDFIHLLATPEDSAPIVIDDFSMEWFRKIVGVSATVRLPLFPKNVEWQAEFRRTSDSMDPDTGSITVFVAVQRPYDAIIPGLRPPLVPNMYCEVELTGGVRRGRYVVPLQAVHQGKVYVVDQNNRLQRVNVEVEMVMANMAVLRHGLEGKVKVVTTDLVPAIDGQLLRTVMDEELMKRITAMKADG